MNIALKNEIVIIEEVEELEAKTAPSSTATFID